MSDWLNGAWTDDLARIDAADRGFLLGDGLFETVAVRDGRVWRVARHLARLRAGADVLGIAVPADDDTLTAPPLLVTARPRAVDDGPLRAVIARGYRTRRRYRD
ncbi:MAG: aminotransferase class IV, partial [Rhodospirillaceae bacterium]